MMTANPTILRMKYGRIVAEFAKRNNIKMEDALNFFYHSMTWELMSEGISDFHCMSDAYLVDNLEREYRKR